MKIIKRLFFWAFLLIGIALITALFLPTQFSVTRSALIEKPVATVFQYVKQLKNQELYGVWWKADPKMKKTYTGQDGQIGFVSAWKSKNPDVGAGQQKIVAIEAGKRIDMELRFIEPFESTNDAYISTRALDARNTRVSWSIKGEMPYPMNLSSLFFDIEQTLGQDLEKGLKNLKRILEK
ncbi:MAG: hypothetical protein RIR94_833 [Bacteroidota bacterium]|jgi:uncharacterized protein YndB with AHSA1/START domain